jgi:hypothetical protein
MIRKRKDEEDDVNQDDTSNVNNDKDTPSKNTENMDPKLQK